MLSMSRRTTTWSATLVALALLFVFAFSALSPALAETAGQRSTRNIILGAIALTAGVILYNNYHHKQVAHDTIVGRTADGGTVYADGRIVYPNGTVVYTSNNGRSRCAYDGYGEQCGPYARGYAWRYADSDQWYGEDLHRARTPVRHHRPDRDDRHRGDGDDHHGGSGHRHTGRD